MRVGSLFAGIGGFDLGFERAGFAVAWHAEIDRAASAILRYRWPEVPNLGDVTKIDGAAIEPVDVICGGFPCQDLSVAGKRAGFTGKRSVLAFEFLRIVREMREATDGRAPTFVVLENVPGLFSSSGGRDFAALLDALGELRPLDIAWRVLDSRYFGVAQRRRRVFVVVDFGGERAEQVLALREGLRGDPPTRRAAREDVAGTLGGGSSERGWPDDLDRCGAFVAGTLNANHGNIWAEAAWTGNLVAHTLRADGFDAGEDGTGRRIPLVADPISAHEQSTYTHEDSGNFRLRNVIPFDTTQVTSPVDRARCLPGAPCHPLAAGAHPPAVAFYANMGKDARSDGASVEIAGPIAGAAGGNKQAVAINLQGGKGQAGFSEEINPTLGADTQGPGLASSSGVRRLTPRECERLQGFPDDWTGIPGMADGPRYKCLGNAVTVNVAEWIARRLAVAICGATGLR